MSDIKNTTKYIVGRNFKITHATKRIQPIKMHVLYMAKHQFGQSRLGSKFGHDYVSGNYPRDDINGFKKKKHNFDISP